METMVIINLVAYLLVSAIVIFIGLDLRRWSSWVYGLYGFCTGFSIGLLYVSVIGGLVAGIVLAFTVMYNGAMTRWHKQRLK